MTMISDIREYLRTGQSPPVTLAIDNSTPLPMAGPSYAAMSDRPEEIGDIGAIFDGTIVNAFGPSGVGDPFVDRDMAERGVGNDATVLEKPRPDPPVTRVDLTEYEIVANEIGLKIPGLERRRLVEFIEDSGMVSYNAAAVEAYLYATNRHKAPPHIMGIRGPGSYRIRWMGLRVTDDSIVYHLPVPLRILKDVATILRTHPTAQFHVSHIVWDPDPFIQVTVNGAKVIFGVWDEPGYTG